MCVWMVSKLEVSTDAVRRLQLEKQGVGEPPKRATKRKANRKSARVGASRSFRHAAYVPGSEAAVAMAVSSIQIGWRERGQQRSGGMAEKRSRPLPALSYGGKSLNSQCWPEVIRPSNLFADG